MVNGSSAHTEQPLATKGLTVDPETLSKETLDDVGNKFAIFLFLTQHGQFSKI